jgi:hypothetical protein
MSVDSIPGVATAVVFATFAVVTVKFAAFAWNWIIGEAAGIVMNGINW